MSYRLIGAYGAGALGEYADLETAGRAYLALSWYERSGSGSAPLSGRPREHAAYVETWDGVRCTGRAVAAADTEVRS